MLLGGARQARREAAIMNDRNTNDTEKAVKLCRSRLMQMLREEQVPAVVAARRVLQLPSHYSNVVTVPMKG